MPLQAIEDQIVYLSQTPPVKGIQLDEGMRILPNRGAKKITGIDPPPASPLRSFKQRHGREDSLFMDELTFNIADYRALARVRTHDGGPAVKARSGFVVFSSNSEPREYEWSETRPAVVDIRSVREMHRAYSRRGKILRFNSPGSHRVYMMPGHDNPTSKDDDPGPMVA